MNIDQYLPMVRRLANALSRRTPLDTEDLYQEGLVGLTIAINRDRRPHDDLGKWARFWVKREMIKAIKRQATFDRHHRTMDFDSPENTPVVEKIFLKEHRRRENRAEVSGSDTLGVMVAAAIDGLTHEARRVIRNRYGIGGPGVSPHACRMALQCSKRAYYSILNDAKQQLRGVLS